MLGNVIPLLGVVAFGIVLALETCSKERDLFEEDSDLQGQVITRGRLASGAVDSRTTCAARCFQLPGCLSLVFVPTSVPNCHLLDGAYTLYDVTSGNVPTIPASSAVYLRRFGMKPVCKGQPVDVVFLVDASGSVSSVNFPKELDFVVQLVSRFKLGPGETQVGVVSFDTVTFPRISLPSFTEISQLSAAVRAIPYTAGGTQTHLGLDHLRTESFQAANGARVGAKRVAVVITDGHSEDPSLTVTAAENLRAADVTVLAVGIGSGVSNSELTAIGTPGQVFSVVNFDTLPDIVDTVVSSSCPKS